MKRTISELERIVRRIDRMQKSNYNTLESLYRADMEYRGSCASDEDLESLSDIYSKVDDRIDKLKEIRITLVEVIAKLKSVK